jgi:hypothetical protein
MQIASTFGLIKNFVGFTIHHSLFIIFASCEFSFSVSWARAKPIGGAFGAIHIM